MSTRSTSNSRRAGTTPAMSDINHPRPRDTTVTSTASAADAANVAAAEESQGQEVSGRSSHLPTCSPKVGT